jgi:hypothetical protein
MSASVFCYVCKGIALRQGVGREPQPLLRCRHGGVMGRERKLVYVLAGGLHPGNIDPVLPAAVLRTHGCRGIGQSVAKRTVSAKAVAVNLYPPRP